jgi:hypothetical protein
MKKILTLIFLLSSTIVHPMDYKHEQRSHTYKICTTVGWTFLGVLAGLVAVNLTSSKLKESYALIGSLKKLADHHNIDLSPKIHAMPGTCFAAGAGSLAMFYVSARTLKRAYHTLWPAPIPSQS